MSGIRRCIFHFPGYIDPSGKSASSARPQKMLEAFQNIGFQTDTVMGYGADRKKQILQIKKNIENGVEYDFLYSESSTMPTAFTEKNHIPKYFFLDFSFFRYCKKQGIRIGLFYRDIHWMFDQYKKNVAWWKRLISVGLYRYDLRQYCRLLDVLFLPSLKMGGYLPKAFCKVRQKALPSGTEDCAIVKKKAAGEAERPLRLLYIGGIGKELYDIMNLIVGVHDYPQAELTICCRETEWEENRGRYAPYLDRSIKIVHQTGRQLDDLYQQADLCCLIYTYSEYRNFAMPYKLFEYIGHQIPILVTEGSAAAAFISAHDIGYCIEDHSAAVIAALSYIHDHPEDLQKKSMRIAEIARKNTWKSRAEFAADCLRQK